MNKKGFTLIELLAVIVILAILALIVSPIISGVITNAKLSAAERSLEGYAQSIELAQAKYQSKNGGNITKDINELSVEGKSIEKIKNQTVLINDAGIVDSITATVDGFICEYKASTGATCTKGELVDNTSTLASDYLTKAGITTDEEILKVKTVNFYNDGRTFDGTSIDVSDGNNGKVLLYKVVNASDSTKYDINIVSNENIYFPSNSERLLRFVTSSLDSNVTSINFNNAIDTTRVTTMARMFHSMKKIESLDLSSFNTSKVTTMTAMFCGCGSLNSLDLSNFNTSKVTDMSSMFSDLGMDSNNISLDISNFDTSKVTTMVEMFDGMAWYANNSILKMPNFNTSNVTDMSRMFENCPIYNDQVASSISNFDTSNVTTMAGMFRDSFSLDNIQLDLSKWNTSNVTNMTYMFSGLGKASPNLYINNFDFSKVSQYNFLFSNMDANSKIYVKDLTTQQCVLNLSSLNRPSTWTTDNVLINQ